MMVLQDILTHLSWSLALAGRKMALASKDRAVAEAAARDRSTPRPRKPAQPALFQHVGVISIGVIFILKLSSISDKVGGEGIELARELFFASKRYAVEDEASRGVALAALSAAMGACIRWRRSTGAAATPAKEAMKGFMVIYLGVLFVGLLAASFLPANRTATIHIVPLLTSKECDAIVSAAERVTSHGRGWDTGRHRHYATEDVPLSQVPHAAAILAAHLEAELYPFISSHFCGSPTACNITLRDGFIVRYLPERQPSLDMHRDGHHVSFNLALSTPSIDFSGGGTGFKRLQEGSIIPPPPKGHRIHIHPPIIHNPKGHRIIHTPKGHALVHGGAVEHSGEAITAGSRYLVVGFLQVERFGRGAWGHRLARLWGGLASEVLMASPTGRRPARTSGSYERKKG